MHSRGGLAHLYANFQKVFFCEILFVFLFFLKLKQACKTNPHGINYFTAGHILTLRILNLKSNRCINYCANKIAEFWIVVGI
jgi:hypothetical protein